MIQMTRITQQEWKGTI